MRLPSYRCSTPHDHSLPNFAWPSALPACHARPGNQRRRSWDWIARIQFASPAFQKPQSIVAENSGKRARSERTESQRDAAQILKRRRPQDVVSDSVTRCKHVEVYVMLVISKWNQHGPRNERSGCGALSTLPIDPQNPCSDTEKHQCQGEHQPAITRRTIARRFRKVHMAQIQSATASTVISKDCFITVCLCLRDAQSIGTVTAKPQQSYPSTKVLKWL